MRVYCLSDIHIDYPENAEWISALSSFDYQDDILILAGDLADTLELLEQCLRQLADRFRKVLFVPGNHDLWVGRCQQKTSFDQFELICNLANNIGIAMEPFHTQSLTIVPFLGWYDYSFGKPSSELQQRWLDYWKCQWPDRYDAPAITHYFTQKNRQYLALNTHAVDNHSLISFSHFLPRIDLMPDYIPTSKRILYPVLGSSILEEQIRQLNPTIHVYGHSHVNQRVLIDGIHYINNAFGYPHECGITAKKLMCLHEV